MSIEIPVLFKNDDIVAVDKPTGISIHNTEDATNLMVLLRRQLPGDADRIFPVHRLDKETSGVQIFARSEVAAANYATEFQTRSVRKLYVGILRGVLKNDDGVWNQPLSDKAEGRVNPAGIAATRIPCETNYKAIGRSKFFTFCEFDLVTGRQHQIRKHAAVAGHTLVGDSRYGDRKYNARMAELYNTDRLFLHCAEIEIRGQVFVSPRPDSFAKLL